MLNEIKMLNNNFKKDVKNKNREKKCAYVKFLYQRCVGKTHLCNTYFHLLQECKEKKFIFNY